MNREDVPEVIVLDDDGKSIPFEDVGEKDISAVMEHIIRGEVVRLDRNLNNLDDLESMLLEEVRARALDNRLDLKTLLRTIQTFDESVKRSSAIIQDKNSNLFNVFVVNGVPSAPTPQEDLGEGETTKALTLQQRKRLVGLFSALIDGSGQPTQEEIKDE